MNEVTRINLGRQPFTIAVDAHKALRAIWPQFKNRQETRAQMLPKK
jgi:hypothetical protein